MAEGAATVQAVKKGGHPASFVVVVGVLFLMFFVIGVLAQIQTNEAFIVSAGQVDAFHPNWAILAQPVRLAVGGMGANEAASVFFGWGIELIYLGFIIGWEVLHDSVSRSGKLMAKVFILLAVVIVIFNFYTDYQYGSLGSWGHWGFAAMVSFIVGFFGTIGMFLVEFGWKRV